MVRTIRGWAVITAVAAVGAVGLAACGGKGGSTASASHPIGDAAIQAADVVARAGAFQRPLDAAPSPDGSLIYFIATGDHGAAVFRVPAAGGTPSVVAQGAPLVKPTGLAVATDGSRIYVADQQAPPTGGGGGLGAILTEPIAGATGSPVTLTALPGTQGRAPRGLDVVNQGDADVIYFTGTDPTNGQTGLFQVPAPGGTIVTLAEGSAFTSPDSVVVSTKGVAYVTDQGAGSGRGQVLRVNGGSATPVLSSLHLGAPAGLTLVQSDATLLVSSIDATTLSDQVLFLDLATGKTAAATKVIGANKNSSGGLHRAHQASNLAWADVSGQVYRVRLGREPGTS